MDNQTLEYMKARVDDALNIKGRIAKLRKNIEFTAGRIIRITIKDNRDNYILHDIEDSIVPLLIQAYVDLAKAEIKRLEQELAEL